MKRYVIASLVCFSLAFAAAQAFAQGTGTPVFNSIPSPQPLSVYSIAFQARSTAEFGDEIILEADTPRTARSVTVLMVTYAYHSKFEGMPPAGWKHSITLNIYLDAASAAAHAPIQTRTQEFDIPWRPEPSAVCGGTLWLGADGICYNGFAFPITFDLTSLNYELPDQFIYGIAYNTYRWGYEPLNAPGPYDLMNVGLNNDGTVTVGADLDPDGLYQRTHWAGGIYGGGVVDSFSLDHGWNPQTPAVKFTTFDLPTTTASCKNGAWANLVRSDFTSFKNQGACVSYVNTGK